MPSSSTPAKACGAAAARTASTATCTLPSVRFLKPTGIDRPEPSWRWIWLSVVRAPIAPQATVSEMYCGVIGSRNSQPTGRPRPSTSSSSSRARAQAGVHVAGAVQVGVVDQALPARWWCAASRSTRAWPRSRSSPSSLGLGRQPLRVLERGLGVVHAARADHHQQPVVRAVEHGRRPRLAAADHDLRLLGRQRQLGQHPVRRGQRHDPLDPLVADALEALGLAHVHVPEPVRRPSPAPCPPAPPRAPRGAR